MLNTWLPALANDGLTFDDRALKTMVGPALLVVVEDVEKVKPVDDGAGAALTSFTVAFLPTEGGTSSSC